ncbi:hypothetical protein [Bacillus sp. Bos-x628]|uniref:hypothetical protein n=1 Tax=Bacillus maqinnsis TaxID=3229854 RepID=UPI00338DD689
MNFTEVQDYILNNIFYVERWTELNELGEEADRIKQVVVNNAETSLLRELPHHFNEDNPVPIDVLAEQCLFILEKDDSVRRAEMGVSYFMASGLYLSFDKNADNFTIAPTVLRRYPRRRVGQYMYNRQDTYRAYQTKRPDEYRRH